MVVLTPAERVVVEAAVRHVKALEHGQGPSYQRELRDAVKVLLAERAGPQPLTVEITWGQVVEGDKLYRAPNGGPARPGEPGNWHEVTQSGPLHGGAQMRIHVKGLPRPIQPVTWRPVTVRRGKTGQAVDALGSVLWSGPSGFTGATIDEIHENEEA